MTNHPSLKEKTAKGLLWGAMNSTLMQILNAVIGVVLLWFLDPDDYGMIAVLAIYSAIAANLQDSGFISALINKRDATHKDLNAVFWFNILVSALIYVILWFCAPLIAAYNKEPQLIALSRYAFLGFFCASFSITPRTILMKELRVKEQAICNIVALIISGAVAIIMAANKMAFWSIATQSIVYVSIVSIGSWYYSRWRPSLQITFKPIKEMFGFSCKMLITGIFNNINKFAFESTMGSFYPTKSIGAYSQANKWNQMGSQTIIGMVQSVAQPMFVQVGDDLERQQRVFRKMLRFTAFVTFPLMFGLSFVSAEFIETIAPPQWLTAVPFLRVLCIAGAFLPLAALYYNFIISRGKSDVFMWNTIAQSAIILANLFGVQYFHLNWFGYSGIMLMVINYVIIIIAWMFIWHYFVWREIRLKLSSALLDVLPFFLVAILTIVITYFATSAISTSYLLLISRILIAAAIYVGILWMLKASILRECIGYISKRNYRSQKTPPSGESERG
jgi:O-antigen/teichoic acid export membrane protein